MTVNPIWERELIQSSRLMRTPLVLMTTTILLTVITCSIGGLASSSVEPSQLGSILYHVFFSLCFAVVCWVGPGIGTLLVTSEHSNRTWDAMVLTGMSPTRIAHGKFLAALTYVGMYLVMLAPIGAVPFVAGGVTALEVITAFVVLAAFSVLAVGFGIAVGSAVIRPAPAMLIAIITAVGVSSLTFLGLGVGGAWLASTVWPSIVPGAPVWLPTAYYRADPSWTTTATLVAGPWTIVLCLAWLFRALAVANMSQETDDGQLGLKRWAVVCFPLLTLVSLVPHLWLVGRREYWIATGGTLGFVFVLAVFCCLLFASDRFQPSARVLTHLRASRAGWFRLWLAPGITRSMLLVLALTTLGTGLVLTLGITRELETARLLGTDTSPRIGSLLSVTSAGFSFLVFCCGLLVFVRAKSKSGAAPRVTLLVCTFIALAGPWLLLAIAGLWTGNLGTSVWLASPSPLFSIVVVQHLLSGGELMNAKTWVQAAASLLWVVLGVLLWLLGERHATRANAPTQNP
jgi:hypothetical protein